MKQQYQVTLICNNGKYRPVSSLVSVDHVVDYKDKEAMKSIQRRGIERICIQRGWNGSKDLTKYGYTKVKIRFYDKAKIEAENTARYEAIKKAKYASGEWKRPKEKINKKV